MQCVLYDRDTSEGLNCEFLVYIHITTKHTSGSNEMESTCQISSLCPISSLFFDYFDLAKKKNYWKRAKDVDTLVIDNYSNFKRKLDNQNKQTKELGHPN